MAWGADGDRKGGYGEHQRWRGCLCFFFQAEDGIRDIGVTGVQTCALPILRTRTTFSPFPASSAARSASKIALPTAAPGEAFSPRARSLACSLAFASNWSRRRDRKSVV